MEPRLSLAVSFAVQEIQDSTQPQPPWVDQPWIIVLIIWSMRVCVPVFGFETGCLSVAETGLELNPAASASQLLRLLACTPVPHYCLLACFV